MSVKRRKRYKMKPRFGAVIMMLVFGISMSSIMVSAFTNYEVPNFYGWVSQDVMSYTKDNKELKVTYELEFSYDVLHDCVIAQEITRESPDAVELLVYVSKGYPIMESFIGQPVSKLEAFAKEVGLNIKNTDNKGDIVSSQSISWGTTLVKDSTVSITTSTGE